MPIRRLPRQLVDQIAAGEVVERPASVVKELVENALDAGATRIEVVAEGGGVDRLVVSDDGSGIEPDELPLAVASHATSKIACSDDLVAIGTMGFRGEALASIASVSRLTITSRTRGRDAAARIDVEGGEAAAVRPAAGPVGTHVEARQLFFNVPARRKFLRSAATELGRIEEVLEAIALCRPAVAFRLVADGKVRVDLPSAPDPADRVRRVLGAADGLLAVHADVEVDGSPIAVWGLVAPPSLARSSARSMRFALNGRAVLDRTLLHAVRDAFRGLVEPGRTPLGFVAVEMDPSTVDVNVHPAKTEVRFRHSGAVHQAVQRAVRAALRAADLVPAFELTRAPAPVSAPMHERPADVVGAPVFAGLGPEILDGGHGDARAAAPSPPVPVSSAGAVEASIAPPVTLHGNRTERRVMQVHGSYLVVEDAGGILVVDQHALHERAMFEELSARLAGSALESQRMLVPVSVAAEPRSIEAAEEHAALLERLGIDLAPSGPRSVAVHAWPTFLSARGVEPGAFVPSLLERLADGEASTTEAVLGDVLDMMACKAAVKAGDRLSPAEVESLLDLRERIERASNCPHGRPTSLRISLRDLERNFGR